MKNEYNSYPIAPHRSKHGMPNTANQRLFRPQWWRIAHPWAPAVQLDADHGRPFPPRLSLAYRRLLMTAKKQLTLIGLMKKSLLMLAFLLVVTACVAAAVAQTDEGGGCGVECSPSCPQNCG